MKKLIYRPDRYKREAGMTLLEILVSIGIFAFMFIFIAQFTKQNHRQVRKMAQDSRSHHSVSHILDIMRQDFRGISYLLDVNHNLDVQFPIKEEEETLEDQTQDTSSPQQKYRKTPLFFSSQYLFEGSEDSMEFSSYSFIEKLDPEAPLAGWVRLRYSIESCMDEENTGLSGSCLMRSVSRYWDSNNKEEEGRQLVLLRGFQSLKFFYADTEGFLEGEWHEKWEPQKMSDSRAIFADQVLELPFPSAVKIEGEKEDRQQDFFFPVSSSYLKVWNPATKAFAGFPEWKAPKKEKEKEKVKPEDSQY